MRQFAIIVFLLFIFNRSGAQPEVSAGIDLSYPEVFTTNNTIINSGQISSGINAGIAYKREELQFFPCLNLSYGRIRLPLQESGNNVAALNFNYIGAMLNENFMVAFSQSQLLIYGGIGFSYLTEKDVAPSGNKTKVANIDSTTNVKKLFPAMNIGCEYDLTGSTDKQFYLSIGLNLRYTLLMSGCNTYYINVTEPGNKTYNYKSSLTGNLVNPVFCIAVHYKTHKRKGRRYME